MVNIKLLMIILNSGYDKKISSMLNRFGIRFNTVSNASGTASSSILTYFGLSEKEKDVFMAIVPDYLADTILDKLQTSFNLGKEGTGLSFTIPISSSNKYLSDGFKKGNSGSDANMEKKNSTQYHLVLTIVSEVYLEQVMNAAKRAGCTGGTTIKGRSLRNKKAVKILGFNIEPEKDIVLNIVSSEDKTKVMEEITKEVGIKTKGKGVCLSLPIDSVVGFDLGDK